MKKSRYTESQIIGVLKEVDAGMKVEEVCRQHGISSATYYIYGLPPYCNNDFSFLIRLPTSIRHNRAFLFAQMGNPLTHSSTTGRAATLIIIIRFRA